MASLSAPHVKTTMRLYNVIILEAVPAVWDESLALVFGHVVGHDLGGIVLVIYRVILSACGKLALLLR